MNNKDIAKYADMDRAWFNYKEFYTFISEQENFRTFAEVGVWKGHAISFLASQLSDRDIEIYGIDLWADRTNNEHYSHLTDADEQLSNIQRMYEHNLEQTNTRHLIEDIKGCSWEVADQFEDGYFDFVYIDAAHDYSSVIKDIEAWKPKVKKGGIFAGHDYEEKNNVVRAVHELLEDINIWPPCVWYIYIE